MSVTTATTPATLDAKILLAEDSPTQAQQLVQVFEQRGYEVETARNGTEALPLVHDLRPDIVVTDVVMPEMDGYALCAAIKSDPALKDIPVVLLTSLGSPEDVIRGLECGADNFIRKPWDESQLLDRVAGILASRTRRDSAPRNLGVEVLLGGKRHVITSERQQILDFLFSSYDEVAQAYEQLDAKRTELERALVDLRSVLDATPDGIVMTDLDGNLRVVNGAADQLLTEILGEPGTTMDRVRTMQELAALLATRTSDPGACRRGFEALLEHPAASSEDEYQLACSGRSILRLAAPVRSATGMLIGRILIFRDVTSQREAEQLKSDLVATVSHELRTPLANVLGFAELLARRDLNESDRESFVETVRSEGRRLTALIDHFLDLQRIEAEGFAPSIEPVDLGPIVRDAVHPFAGRTEGHRLDLRIPEEPLTVLADADRVRRVVENLISNALKYSPDGGNVVVRTDRGEDAVRLSVDDSGLGIRTDEQARIFTKFYRAESTRSRGIGGTGLGLELCKEIVEAHGGRIGFESVEGKGSTFWFELPAP